MVMRFIPTYVGHTRRVSPAFTLYPVHPHIRGAYPETVSRCNKLPRFIPTYVGHTAWAVSPARSCAVHPHIRGAYRRIPSAETNSYGSSPHTWGIQPRRTWNGLLYRFIPTYVGHTRQLRFLCSSQTGSSPHTWGIHWTTVRKMAGFSHFSYDFTQKSYFVQGLVFFGVIGAEAFPTHRRGRNQCLPGAHGGSVRNL